MGELLAPFAAADDVGWVSLRGEPEETVAMSFGGNGSIACMMTAIARMNVVEDAAAFLQGDASEESS